jgi:acetolactate decarboxylase
MMPQRIRRLFIVLLLALACVSGLFLARITGPGGSDALYQVSTLGALMKGDYDGSISMGGLKGHGDFGIGTFNNLDGEMVEIGGEIYQVKYDGTVLRAGNDLKTPFSAVAFFKPGNSAVMREALDHEGLLRAIDGLITNKNIPYAVRVSGRFGYVKTRSVPRQDKPYRALAEVVKEQSVFEMRDVEGAIVGFKIPEYMQGLNAAGYHLHFISADRKFGGHLLSSNALDVRIEVDDKKELCLALSASPEFAKLDLSGNQSKDIEKVEGK